MDKIITKVEATKARHTFASLAMPTIRKTVAYLRVSTASDEQENSFQAQSKHFTDLIKNSPDMEFIGLYADEGISGTGTSHRAGFTQMMRDAIDGKFSLILTKSLSRFARNTVDSLTAIRKLKEHGVEVRFEKENISTFDGKGELLLTIMSSLAQEESRSISENVTWGIRHGFEEGKVSMPYSSFLGYRKGPKGPEVDPEQAEVVRTIYKKFLEGGTTVSIVRELEAAGIPSPTGRSRWHTTTIQSILKNEAYKGESIRQKTFTTDFLTHKSKKNEGELPQYRIQNSHPAIVTEEQWELVQLEIERRARMGNRFSAKGPMASRLVCADCGGYFGAKTWHSTDAYRRVVWRCNDKYNPTVTRASGGKKCTTTHVTEEQVYEAFGKIVSEIIEKQPMIIAACEAVLDELLNTHDLDARKEKLDQQEKRIAKGVDVLVARQSRMAQDSFKDEYGALGIQMEQLEKKQAELQQERTDREYRARQSKLFLKVIEGLEVGPEIDSELFLALVDKVIVGDGLTFTLKNGEKRTIMGSGV